MGNLKTFNGPLRHLSPLQVNSVNKGNPKLVKCRLASGFEAKNPDEPFFYAIFKFHQIQFNQKLLISSSPAFGFNSQNFTLSSAH